MVVRIKVGKVVKGKVAPRKAAVERRKAPAIPKVKGVVEEAVFAASVEEEVVVVGRRVARREVKAVRRVRKVRLREDQPERLLSKKTSRRHGARPSPASVQERVRPSPASVPERARRKSSR